MTDPTFWDKVHRSRERTPEQRFRDTLEMIDLSRSLMTAGIRMQFPDADDARVRDILLERIRIVQKLENAS